MHFDLKRIAVESVAEALAKAERYRLLNEPSLAESICLDILAVSPDNQETVTLLLLARTDQFASGLAPERARELLPRIQGDYERAYYAGLIAERSAHAQLRRGGPGGSARAYHAFREAMASYEKAERLRPAGNDDAILRWNTCARIIMRQADVRPLALEEVQPILSE